MAAVELEFDIGAQVLRVYKPSDCSCFSPHTPPFSSPHLDTTLPLLHIIMGWFSDDSDQAQAYQQVRFRLFQSLPFEGMLTVCCLSLGRECSSQGRALS